MIMIVIGRRGYGKTTFALNMGKKVRSLGKRENLYIFSPNPIPPSFKNIIKIKNIKELSELSNATVILDDATVSFFGSMRSQEIRDMCVSSRHKKLDLIFVFHNVAQTPPLLISLCDVIVFFGLSDRIDAIKSKTYFIPELYKAALSATRFKKYQWISYNMNTSEIQKSD